jgi:flagellar biosynthesis protein FlhG
VLRAKARLQPTGPPPRLVVLAGGKGGVGTTTLAVKLSMALAQLGKRVVLVDAALHRGDVAPLCGLHEDDNVADVLSARRTVHEVLQRGPAGIQIVPGAWAPSRPPENTPVAQQRLIQQLRDLGRHADIVLLDAGSGAGDTTRRYCQAADRGLLITTPEPVSIMDTYAAVKALSAESVSPPLEIVVNRAADAEQAQRVLARIDASSRRFLGRAIQAAGFVPEDPQWAAAGRSGGPLAIDRQPTPATRGVARIAAALSVDRGKEPLGQTSSQRRVA